MATKLGRKQLPGGYSPEDFTYQGRPAKDQGDFGDDVGIADCACVNQFGEANNSKYYHGGVVKSGDGKWWVYLEWGRIKSNGKSWNGGFHGADYQFVQCSSESDARAFFAKQLKSKNTSRLEQKDVGGVTLWAAKVGSNGKAKDGYLIQDLATRERGLPDAYRIVDDASLAKPVKVKKVKQASSVPSYAPQEISLAKALVGGTQSYARAASEATGVVPTLDAINNVRDNLLPLALQRIKAVQDNLPKSADDEEKLRAQLGDKDLIDLSKMVASLVPTVIPVSASQDQRQRMTILSTENIFQRQQDLDAFEAALASEQFEVEQVQPSGLDVDKVLNAQLRWIDPKSKLGRWLAESYLAMSNNRHYNVRQLRIKNMFSVVRPDRDVGFLQSVAAVAKKYPGTNHLVKARLQPKYRPDVSDISDMYDSANVFLGIHGTRAVNIQPIMSTNFRNPKALRGVHISGAAFGYGTYFATDAKKSYNYCGVNSSYYGSGGSIPGRGWFMFLCDTIMGSAYKARTTGSWTSPPQGCDSVAAYPDFMPTLQNDEHIIFDPSYQRIRYLIEGE